MISCIGYICATFLHCERLGASSGCQPNQMISCIAHIYAPFLRYELKDVSWSNDISHCAQLWTFSPLWARRWVFRLSACPNDFSHWAHLCTFALWVSRCLLRWTSRPNDLLHWAHFCSFSTVWVIRGLFRWADKPKDFHIEHICAILLHCELEGVSSDYLLDQKICGIEHICAISLQNETTNACSDRWHM